MRLIIITRQLHGSSEWEGLWKRSSEKAVQSINDLLLVVNGYKYLKVDPIKQEIGERIADEGDVHIAVHGDRNLALTRFGLDRYAYDSATYSLGDDNNGQNDMGKAVKALADIVRAERGNLEGEIISVISEIKKQCVREKFKQFLGVMSPLSISTDDNVKKCIVKRLQALPTEILDGLQTELQSEYLGLSGAIRQKNWDSLCEVVSQTPLLLLARRYL